MKNLLVPIGIIGLLVIYGNFGAPALFSAVGGLILGSLIGWEAYHELLEQEKKND